MLNNFTQRAKEVLDLAGKQASSLGHNFVGSEHLLLGILAEKNGVGAQTLEKFGVSLEGVRETIQEIEGKGTPGVQVLGFTPRTKRIFEISG